MLSWTSLTLLPILTSSLVKGSVGMVARNAWRVKQSDIARRVNSGFLLANSVNRRRDSFRKTSHTMILNHRAEDRLTVLRLTRRLSQLNQTLPSLRSELSLLMATITRVPSAVKAT